MVITERSEVISFIDIRIPAKVNLRRFFVFQTPGPQVQPGVSAGPENSSINEFLSGNLNG